MRLRTLWRRAAVAMGVYGAAALGIAATVVAARELSKDDFARFALVFATTTLLQTFVDLTVEEVVIKYGNRYVARKDWGRFRRLLEVGLGLKMLGGLVGSAAVVGAALLAPWLWNIGGLRTPMLIAALVPFVQAPEGMASAILLIRNRYDIRGAFLLVSMALRLAAIAAAASFGVVTIFVAIVLAQVAATAAVSVAGVLAVRRWPTAPPRPLEEDRREIFRFGVQSSIASGLSSLRALLPTLLVGAVSTKSATANFRVALAPQTAFASLSAPARLVLLAEQTRDIEQGNAWRAYRLLRRYILATGAIAIVTVPVLWLLTPALVRLVFTAKYLGAVGAVRLMLIAAAVQLVLGWSKSFPVSIGRPGLRTAGQVVELAVLIPGVVVLGWRYGATGAAGGILAGSVALGAYWTVTLAWLRARPLRASASQVPA